MNRIRVLSEDTANKIAAGEVIERPASVVKELVENALDASATEIIIEVKSGGRNFIRVSDNGTGMARDDALLCLERHSTSKIRDVKDLDSILTMGFRGEAIPSIASVSRFTITTCEQGKDIGTFVKVEGGRTVNVTDVGRSAGTTVEVKNIFFNIPARRKYLKSVERETAEIARVVDVTALANPEVHFQLLNNDRTILLTPWAKSLSERIVSVFGKQFYQGLLEVKRSGNNVPAVSGFAGRPDSCRSSRSHQFLFINRRPVYCPGISWAVTEAYHSLIPRGRYPVFILFIEVEPSEIDVNVHPAKREVRFRNEWEIKDMITRIVRESLTQSDLSPEVEDLKVKVDTTVMRTRFETQLIEKADDFLLPKDVDRSRSQGTEEPLNPRDKSSGSTSTEIKKEQISDSLFPIGRPRKNLSLRYIGQLGNSYLLGEDDEGLVMIDQHAAHERVLYERLLKIRSGQKIKAQSMLVSTPIEFTAGETMVVEESMKILEKLGFGLHPFGRNTFVIDALPEYLGTVDQERVLRNIVEELKQERAVKSNEIEEAVQYAVCRAAVKARDVLTEREVQSLLKDLESCEMPYTCPHGRPTIVRMSMKEIEKHFKRR